MRTLAEEVKTWNTPIVGAYTLWRFTQGYTDSHPEGRSPVLLLHFFVSAILTSKGLSAPINNRRKDLASYSRSFTDSKQTDLLHSIQDRVNSTKGYTLASIDIAIQYGLLNLHIDDGCIYPKVRSRKPTRGMAPKQSAVAAGNKAETLGRWFAVYDVSQVSSLLKVVL